MVVAAGGPVRDQDHGRESASAADAGRGPPHGGLVRNRPTSARRCKGENRTMPTATATATAAPQITWLDDSGTRHSARWRSLAGHPAPARVQAVGDELGADEAYRLIDGGTALL